MKTKNSSVIDWGAAPHSKSDESFVFTYIPVGGRAVNVWILYYRVSLNQQCKIVTILVYDIPKNFSAGLCPAHVH